jgi:WD40 repeat protein
MFDPYHRWLAIPPDQRPPTLYQLLGVAAAETDPAVIEEAALRQASHVRIYQTGPYAKEGTRILNEIGQARATLLNPEKRKEYDARLAAAARPAVPPPLPPPLPIGDEPQRPHRPTGSIVPAACGYGAVLLLGGLLVFLLALPQPRAADPVDPPPRKETPKQAPVIRTAPRTGPRLLQTHESPLRALALAADSASVFSAGGSGAGGDPIDCVARLWSTRTKKIRKLFAGHRAPIHALAVSANGEQLLTGSGGYEVIEGCPAPVDCTVRLWDVSGGKQVFAFTEHQAPVCGVGFLPGSGKVISCDRDGTVYVWGVGGKTPPKRLPGDAFPAACLAVSGDGRYAVAGATDGGLHLWELKKLEKIDHFARGKGPIHAVAFSPDNRLIAAGGGSLEYRSDQIVPANCVVRLMEVASGEVVKTLEGHTAPVRAIAFSGKGRWVVTGGLDGTVRLWSSKSGKPLQRFAATGGGVISVVVRKGSGSGEVLAGCLGGTVEEWDLPDNLERNEVSP